MKGHGLRVEMVCQLFELKEVELADQIVLGLSSEPNDVLGNVRADDITPVVARR